MTTDELQSLPGEVASFLVASCYAIDDIMHHYRILVSVITEVGESDLAKSMFFVRKLAQLRTTSSKLVEYDKLISSAQHPSRIASNQQLDAVLRSEKTRLRRIRKGLGRSIAEKVRNELSAHYSLAAAEKAIAARSGNREHVLLPNFTQGNSHYLIGDEIMFLDVFEPDPAGQRSSEDISGALETIGLWQDWTLEATKTFQRVHQSFLSMVFLDFFPGKAFERVWVPLDRERHIGVLGETTIPLWWFKKS